MAKGTFRKLAAGAGISASLLVASSFLGSSSAWAAPSCGAGSVATYTAPGFSCSVGPLTFSHFTVTPTTGGSLAVIFDSAANAFNPDIVTVGGHTEYGFSLAYTAVASSSNPMNPSSADLAVTYDVTSSPGNMVDAYMAFSGGASGVAVVGLTETLSNGKSMSIVGTTGGTDTVTFSPTNSLQAIKDQDNTAFDGTALASILVDGFSVTGVSVPEPATIALFAAGLLGCAFALRRRRLPHS